MRIFAPTFENLSLRFLEIDIPLRLSIVNEIPFGPRHAIIVGSGGIPVEEFLQLDLERLWM